MMVHCTDHQKEERSGNKLYTIKGKKAKKKREVMILLPCILQQTDSRRDRNGREKSLQINVQVGGEMSPNPPLSGTRGGVPRDGQIAARGGFSTSVPEHLKKKKNTLDASTELACGVF